MKQFISLSVIFLLIFIPAMSQAMHLEFQNTPRTTQEVPAELNARYAKLWPNLSETKVEISNKKNFSVSQYTLEFLHDDNVVRPVTVEFYKSNKFAGPRPTFTVLPITGGSYTLSKFFAKWLVKKGYNAVVVFRPETWFKAEHSMTYLESLFRRSIIEQRSILEWLRHRPEVDTERMGTLGTSLGAFASVVIAALEPSLKVNVVLMGGQNAPEIFPISKEAGVVHWKEARMKHTGNTIEEFSTRAKNIFKTDPIYFSKYVNPKNIIQFITTRDKHVPTKYQWDLWETMQRPEAYTFKIGHYSAVLYLPTLLTKVKKQLKKRLK